MTPIKMRLIIADGGLSLVLKQGQSHHEYFVSPFIN